MMRTCFFAAAMAAVAVLGVEPALASDRVAVYAKVDRVVFEPSDAAPDAVQVWGTFSIAVTNNPNDYRPAARGYLYFRPGTNQQAARREWTDLNAIAGSGQIVALGNRWEGVPRLRQAAERPADPDPYPINTGLTKISGRTDYAPIRALADARQ
jgi:hypothetical protein